MMVRHSKIELNIFTIGNPKHLVSLLNCSATEIHLSVKRALQSCCQQLRSQLMHRNAIKDAKTRRSKLIRYVPDVSRSLFGLLNGMRQRHNDIDSGTFPASPHKKLRLDPNVSSLIIQKLESQLITEDTIHSSLVESIDTETPTTLDVTATNDNDATADLVKRATIAAASLPAVPLYIIPLFNLDDATHDIRYPQFTFRPIVPFPNKPMES